MNLLDSIALVLDFETTGFEHETDRAVEVAALWVNNGVNTAIMSSLINPGIPIPCTASGIHHIMDVDVEGAPHWSELKSNILERPFNLFVAHNAPFDMGFFAHDGGLPDKPVLCTWRMAKKLLPEAPSFTNMALNYYLGLGRPLTAHRALADAEVTAKLYTHLLSLAAARATDPAYVDQERFLAWLEAPIMEKTVGFGKHKGMLWADIARTDPGYLRWCLDKSDVCQKNPDTKFTIETLLRR